ncbi:DUF3149 domain-containing protein [Neisseria iguanae]|uniref:DUF3149 domain-containing protein n=1 Tax=Neisseria iguanae TaxID=90242 RepID=A0A2P7TZB8_9NEIS|nr:DUF3149 domain-containing protein [Neisseria iguanae]
MEVFAEFFKSPVGILSLITLLSICVIAAFLFFWVKKQADKFTKHNSGKRDANHSFIT